MSARTKDNFTRAYAKLEEFLNAQADPDLRRTAVIHAFEYTFEAGWKLLRSKLVEAGEVPAGPRDSIAKAASIGIIDPAEEEDWLDMLADRNNSVHTYNEELAVEMEERIQTRYRQRLLSLAAV